MKVKVHLLISGRVQGVFFRSEISNEAERYGVNGWVRNLPDGRVETVFEGDKDSVDRLISFCENGLPVQKYWI